MCVCVCVCVIGQLFFGNRYLIKQYRHSLSTHFIYPFESSHRFYVIRWELTNKPPTNTDVKNSKVKLGTL